MTSGDDPGPAGAPRCPRCGRALSPHGAECPDCAPTFADDHTFDPDAATTLAGETVESDPAAATTLAAGEPAPFTGPRQIAHYRVIRELGAGGMGTVFEAHDERMDRRVALKVLSRHQATSDKSGLRFEREAWIAGKLDHPALVKVYDRGTWEELSYYSMELVSGGSLHDVVSNLKRWGRDDRHGLEFGTGEYVNWAVRHVIDAARGLDYAHRQGIVHRDVKPMNLLLSGDEGAVKIADFGLAVDTSATRMTTAGKLLGTIAYMAPEQILGKQDQIRPATDVYALGVTLFELLTLDLPFTAKTQQMYMNAVLTAEARKPRKLNERVGKDLETVIGKALEREPRDRYASAGELAADLEAVLQFRPIAARPPTALERTVKWVRRRPMHAALIGVLVVAAPTVAFLGQRALERRELLLADRVAELRQNVRHFRRQGRTREMVEAAGDILRIDPDHLWALQVRGVGFGMLADDATDDAEAAELRRRSLEDVSRIVELEPGSAWTHHLKAFVLRESGREEDALAEEASAAGLRTGEPTDNDLYFAGVLAVRQGNLEQAVGNFTDALAIRPSRLELLYQRSEAYEQLGRLPEAIQDLRLAVALNPEDAVSMLNLGSLLMRSGSLDEGSKYVKTALELRPDDPLAYQALAHEQLELGRSAVGKGDRKTAGEMFAEAERLARRSLELHPGGDTPGARRGAAVSHLNLGNSLVEQYRLAETPDEAQVGEAVKHFEQATQLLEQTPGREAARILAITQVNVCDLLIQTGELARALGSCLAVTEAMPEEPVAFYNLAGVHALQGRPEEAFAALERCYELGDREWGYLETDDWFVSLRSDPRFRSLIERMKAG